MKTLNCRRPERERPGDTETAGGGGGGELREERSCPVEFFHQTAAGWDQVKSLGLPRQPGILCCHGDSHQGTQLSLTCAVLPP